MAEIFMNRMQREAMMVGANKTVIVAGRGTGKGLLHAAVNLENFQMMPRSTTAFVVPNARRGLTNTLPSMFCHWENWGYIRGVHWVVGQKPPRELDWPAPLYKPEHYENVISFYNGSVGQIITQERAGTSNSKSFDFIDIDEAKFVNFEKLKSETIPANRGQVREFGSFARHHGMLITSDIPVTQRGRWFLRYEDDMDAEVISTIRSIVAELWELRRRSAEEPDNRFRRRDVRDMERLLCELQRGATFFGRYPSTVNLEVLGEAWFRQMKRDLPASEFMTSILCQDVRIIGEGFYSSMSDKHLYTSANFSYIDSLAYDTQRLAEDGCRLDGDLQEKQPLCVAFDYNAQINCLVVGQPDEEQRRLNVLKSFYVKHERKLPDLVDDFCRYYAAHRTREVVFYYDTTALGSNYAVNDQDFAWVVSHQFEKNGWSVMPIFIGRPMAHLEKHLLINRGFDGRARLTPFINETHNENLIASMTHAGIVGGKKDKRYEKLRETDDNPLETRTDFSDAFDTLYIGCERFPQTGAAMPVTSDF